jgi:hypothetical protein
MSKASCSGGGGHRRVARRYSLSVRRVARDALPNPEKAIRLSTLTQVSAREYCNELLAPQFVHDTF